MLIYKWLPVHVRVADLRLSGCEEEEDLLHAFVVYWVRHLADHGLEIVDFIPHIRRTEAGVFGFIRTMRRSNPFTDGFVAE